MGLKKTLGIILLVPLMLLLSPSPASADSPTVSDVAEELICQCGCTMGLNNCTHEECMSRATMNDLIEQRLAQGQSKDEIVQFFVTQYGEVVLASPPKRGFNLVAWILPFAAILGGGGAIYFTLRKWVGQGRLSQTAAVTEDAEGNEAYQQQMEKELKEFTGEGFR